MSIDLVECHSDFEYAERPVALQWNGQRLGISEILKSWRAPGEKGFRVRVVDGQLFELFYNELQDEWRIHQP
jgi:hypothetical protein